MKAFVKIISFVGLAVCGACSNDKKGVDAEPASVGLSISTTIQTRAVMTTFSSGDRMNLYLKTEASAGSGDFVSGVSASLESGNWKISPAVEFKEKEAAYLFAFYPYSGDQTAPTAIPVDAASQTDYLYSGDAVAVSYSSPEGVLKMEHALSIIAFNISKEGYTGEGKLASVKVVNIPVNGTLDVSSGVISNTNSGEYSIVADKQIAQEGWTAQLPQMFSLPFAADGKNVSVILTVDGREYSVFLPEEKIDAGMKYVFRLVMTDDKVIALPDLTEKISLDKEGNNSQLGGYGLLKLTYSGNRAVAPLLSGAEKVNGIVYWGDHTSESYSPLLIHDYSENGMYELLLETWGASLLNIENLDGVESIDISDF